MDGLLGPQEDLLSIASVHARDVDALCLDVAAIIFPSAVHTPSEATISAVSVKLLQIVRDIEAKLQGTSSESITGSLLARSGFLREPDLVDFALARVAEDNLIARLGGGFSEFAVDLLDSENKSVAEAAQTLLAADSLQLRSQGRSYLTLPPELLYKVCWRIVAALEVLSGSRSELVISNARSLLSSYHEAHTAPASARKIVHFIGDAARYEMSNPHHAGIHLFAAQLSADLNIGHDHILRMIDFESAFPMMVLLAADGVPRDDALQIIIDLRGNILTAREAALFETEYAQITPDMARDLLNQWSSARMSVLSFGKK
ncbi:MAG: hypothetical protein ACK4ZE_01405 [Sphingorhabdus sp.]